jgi:endonuclease/exonuclease/phosphatase family metal-dependent hydrolase
MTIQVDSREHQHAIQDILTEFNKQGVKHYTSKLFVGDYMSLDNPRLVIDRKQNLHELCGNVCQQHERFRAEMQRAKENGIKIATYNVAMFGREVSGFKAQDILAEMRSQNVDVLCIQEYNEMSGNKKNSETYKEYFPYMAVGREDMVIFSRYPITRHQTMLFEETNNSAMWADINIKGSEFRIFNVHMETTGINHTLHQASKLQAKNYDVSDSQLLSAIYGNYMMGMYFRAGQAIQVANEMRQSPHPIILCGDFNDVPYSFVYNTLLGNMVDGFKECGSGFMKTYRGSNKKPVRIDYIFHDEGIKGLTYYRSDLTYSDHFPIYMKIAL